MAERDRELSRYNEFATGDPVAYLPPEAVPPLAIEALGKGALIKVEATGELVELPGQQGLFLAISRVTLL